MKKKSTSQSAFFNLRVLLALVLALAGVFIALLGFGAFSNASAQANATQQPKAEQFGQTTVISRVAQRSVAAAARTAIDLAANRG